MTDRDITELLTRITSDKYTKGYNAPEARINLHSFWDKAFKHEVSPQDIQEFQLRLHPKSAEYPRPMYELSMMFEIEGSRNKKITFNFLKGCFSFTDWVTHTNNNFYYSWNEANSQWSRYQIIPNQFMQQTYYLPN